MTNELDPVLFEDLGNLVQVSAGDGLSTRAMRHSFASHLLVRGANLVAVQALLGLASLSTTRFYTHTSVEQLKREYHRAHPRSAE